MKSPEHERVMLPPGLRSRLASFGAYVRTVIEERQRANHRLRRLTRADIQVIEHVAMACFLNHLLREGLNAAHSAVHELAESDIDGFAVGTTLFSGENENVMRGANLARALRKCLSVFPIDDLLERDFSPRQIVLELVKKVTHGKSVD